MGTSLVVYPFAGLLFDARPETPRLLINREVVSRVAKGCWDLPTLPPLVLIPLIDPGDLPG